MKNKNTEVLLKKVTSYADLNSSFIAFLLVNNVRTSCLTLLSFEYNEKGPSRHGKSNNKTPPTLRTLDASLKAFIKSARCQKTLAPTTLLKVFSRNGK
jgi:hypothetical protein